jgi:hypothetical protein
MSLFSTCRNKPHPHPHQGQVVEIFSIPDNYNTTARKYAEKKKTYFVCNAREHRQDKKYSAMAQPAVAPCSCDGAGTSHNAAMNEERRDMLSYTVPGSLEKAFG